MSEMLQSIRSDLLSRRLLPWAVALLIALVAAVGYALSAGGSSTLPPAVTPSAAAPSTGETGAGNARVSVAGENPHLAVSETPGGVHYQAQGPTRDPFIPLPIPAENKSAAASSPAGSGSQSSSGGSSSSSTSSTTTSSSPATGSTGSSTGGGASGGSTPAPPSARKPTKTEPKYTIAVEFGVKPATPGQGALTHYKNLAVGQQLPSTAAARIAYQRVTSSGKGAVFALIVAPILHGKGRCLPSNSECETIDLEAGQSEELEYVEADGQTVVYELKVLSVTKDNASASAARAHAVRAAQ